VSSLPYRDPLRPGAEAPEAPASAPRLLSAVGLTGSATLLTVALGVGTTKVIALVAGPSGIALMGLYRYLGALASRSLLLGLDTTLVQRISTARDGKTVSDAVGAAFLAMILQGMVIAGLAFASAQPIGRWLFGEAATPAQVVEIRVVLAMAYANLVLQVMTAVLGGRVEVRKVAFVGVVAAFVTLAAIYPLLRLGGLGLALNVGSGSVAGAALAAMYIFRTVGFSFRRVPLADRFRALWAMLARSAFLILHPLVMMSVVVSVQSLIRARFALPGLGAYNAAMTIFDTALMVIVASARSFFLPSLGQLQDPEQKARVVNRVLRVNLMLASAAALVAIVGAPILIPVLFSGRFESAIEILPPFSLALVGQAFVWSYAMFYVHQARYRLFFGLDLIWAMTYLGATIWVVSRQGSLTAAAWAYASSYCLSGLVYTFVAVRAFGLPMLDRWSLRLSLVAFGGSLAACLLHRLGLFLVDAAILGAGLGALGFFLQRALAEAREGEAP
jgi:O-antigen/teichoic acid export membrane protein